LQELLAEQESLNPAYVQTYAGSSAPLHQAVLAFCSPIHPMVTADPGYEAGERAAEFIGAKVIRVPLTNSFAHDVERMVAAHPQAGLFYVCNPNNPTGTLTPRSSIDWLVKNKPKGSIVLLDEAYIHIAGAAGCSDLVADDKDIVILRTFSKIYGMAGLRCGAAFGRPDLLERIRCFGWTALPTTAVAAAIASLNSRDLVLKRRKIIDEIRADLFEFLDQQDWNYVPSVSNHFMLNVSQPGQRIIDILRKERIFVGRVWPSWPAHVRVSIGTPAEMERFKSALRKLIS
jgi:histidinol-phosphate/aromatic aminotransferase/cobyric acid decarboxylase-like protein